MRPDPRSPGPLLRATPLPLGPPPLDPPPLDPLRWTIVRGTPLRRTPLRQTTQNFALFSLSRHNFRSFFPLLGVFSWYFEGLSNFGPPPFGPHFFCVRCPHPSGPPPTRATAPAPPLPRPPPTGPPPTHRPRPDPKIIFKTLKSDF